MPGVDLLLSRVLSEEIKKNLDQNILKQLEKKLFFDYGMSIKLSMEHFDKFHNVLKKISDIDLETFEKNCIEKIIIVSKHNDDYKLRIKNQKLSETIFDFYGDIESRKTLMCVMDNSLTVSEILKKSGVLKSPLYRKIENLLLYGLILETGKILKNQKRVSKYQCVFDQVIMSIGKNNLELEVVVNAKTFNESSIAKMNLFEI